MTPPQRSIAVVIPAYNAAPFIRETLDSVRAQTRRPDQVILVDDGSRDGTVDIAREWQSGVGKDLALTVLTQPNQGPSAARNLGIRTATTDLIALLDADDLYLPGLLERLADGLERAPEAVLSFADAEVFTEEGVTRPSLLAGTRIDTVPTSSRAQGLELMIDSAFASLLWGSYIPTAATLFDRAAGIRAGLFDLRLHPAEDREFLLRLSRLGPFAYYRQVLARKREHASNATHPTRIIRCERIQLRVLQKMRAYARLLKLSDVERKALDRAMADQIRTMQYTASTKGPGTYLGTCLFFMRHGIVGPVFRPRHLARALFLA